jgi:hypothetical protein
VLVAYLDLDQELLAPRYRAATQAHWLVTRGAQLLAGRPRNETLLLLQTRLADHPVVTALAMPGRISWPHPKSNTGARSATHRSGRWPSSPVRRNARRQRSRSCVSIASPSSVPPTDAPS